MWIELSDDIESELSEIDNPLDEYWIAVNSLFDSMLKCQHIVYCSLKLLKSFSKNDYIELKNKKLIDWILNNRVYVYECRNIVKQKIIVDVSTTSLNHDGNCIRVPLTYFLDIKETKILAENETDTSLFEGIYRIVKEKQKVHGMYSIRSENHAFHGGNVATTIEQVVGDRRIVLCIVDSDKCMPSSKFGSTYDSAKKAFMKSKNKTIIDLYVLKVREKENLFPPKFYRLLENGDKTLMCILDNYVEKEDYIRYFDIKDGIKYKHLKNETFTRYYNPLITDLVKVGLCQYPECDNDDFLCVKGIGAKRNERTFDVFLKKDISLDKAISGLAIHKENYQEIDRIRKNVYENLPDYLKRDWENIFELLFSWCCCISKEHIPVYVHQ